MKIQVPQYFALALFLSTWRILWSSTRRLRSEGGKHGHKTNRRVGLSGFGEWREEMNGERMEIPIIFHNWECYIKLYKLIIGEIYSTSGRKWDPKWTAMIHGMVLGSREDISVGSQTWTGWPIVTRDINLRSKNLRVFLSWYSNGSVNIC